MKHVLFSVLLATVLLVSCNQKNNEATINNPQIMDNDSISMHNDSTLMKNDSTMMNGNTKMMHENSNTYSCPMHPEIHGNLNDKCSKCGMKLTVPVPESAEKK